MSAGKGTVWRYYNITQGRILHKKDTSNIPMCYLGNVLYVEWDKQTTGTYACMKLTALLHNNMQSVCWK